MRALWLLLFTLVVSGAVVFAVSRADDRLVVYCAHDAMHAEGVLEAFTRETGIEVAVVYDTEATKALGLVERLLREQDAPRADVFWNNEVLGTMKLAREGALDAHKGTSWERIPDRWKDPGGRWIGFGGRMRVWVAGAGSRDESVDDPPTLYEEGLAGLSLTQMAFAKPIFGTTRAHVTALWSVLGEKEARRILDRMIEAGAQEVAGNAVVRDLVVSGGARVGWTDTDDVFVALDAGRPVWMMPVRVAGRALCVPNTAAVVRGTGREAAARTLVDWLASADNELRLARSRARQIPLGAIAEDDVPDPVLPFWLAAQDAWPVQPWDDVADEVLDWLRERAAR